MKRKSFNTTIVGGTFHGADIEPGTFHGGDIEPGTFHGADIEPGTFHGADIEPGTFHNDQDDSVEVQCLGHVIRIPGSTPATPTVKVAASQPSSEVDEDEVDSEE